MAAREGTKFHACRACWERGCDPVPDDDTTQFHGSVTGYVDGRFTVTIDEDGDPVEGDPEFEREPYDTGDTGSYECDCCSHSFERLSTTNGYYGDKPALVVLWQDDETEVVSEYAGQDDDDYEADEDEDEDEDEPMAADDLTVKDDGKTIDVAIVIDDTIIPRETPEIQIIQLT